MPIYLRSRAIVRVLQRRTILFHFCTTQRYGIIPLHVLYDAPKSLQAISDITGVGAEKKGGVGVRPASPPGVPIRFRHVLW